MKQRTTATTVETNIQDRKAFTIKTNGKAFRTLIDGIYSNKVLAPVRELMTNAFDGHLARGNVDRPFEVHMPTLTIPEFIVRDYGVGMDHEMVMNLYTTLFDSSKDDTNDQVGMLGLGSKSPFAYCDTFTVTCYDGEAKRVYNAHLDADVPQLGLMYEGPSTDEQGVEVKFPVNTGDFGQFKKAIERVMIGFDTLPVITGGDADKIQPREVLAEGDGYRLYGVQDGYGYDDYLSAVNVRMGCVVYPVGSLYGTRFDNLRVPRNVRFVIDVPIGSSDVTTNREALADDAESRANIGPWLDTAFDDYKATVLADYAAAKTKLEQCQTLEKIDYEWRRAFDLPMILNVGLMGLGWSGEVIKSTLEQKRPGYYVQHANKPSDLVYEWRYENRNYIQFIIDDADEPRRRTRIREHASNRPTANLYVIPAEHAKITPVRLKKLCGFTDDNFVNLADLDDPGPVTKQRGAQASKTYLEQQLEGTKAWVTRMRGKVKTSNRRYYGNKMDSAFVREALGITADEHRRHEEALPWATRDKIWDSHVLPLTVKQVEKLNPDPDMEISAVIKRHWEESGYDQQVRDQVFVLSLRAKLAAITVDAYSTADKLLAAEGVEIPSARTTGRVEEGLHLIYGVGSLSEAVPNYRYRSSRIKSRFEVEFGPDGDLIDQAVEALRRKYPVLFVLDQGDIDEYIRQQNG